MYFFSNFFCLALRLSVCFFKGRKTFSIKQAFFVKFLKAFFYYLFCLSKDTK